MSPLYIILPTKKVDTFVSTFWVPVHCGGFFVPYLIPGINFLIVSNLDVFENCLILLFARCVFTNSSQSWLGALRFLSMTISTRSPFFNLVSKGNILSFMIAPVQWLPISVWTA